MGDTLLLILNILGTLYLVYFAGVIVLGLFRKKREFPAAAPQKRIAAVIAARNEAGVIGEAVRTLLAQDYPRELFDIWVIPNNCTDDTEDVAANAGARVLRCAEPVSCKGDVLRFAFGHLLAMDYDAFCIFDADNLVDPGFFRAANDALCHGARIGQGFRDSKNSRESWVAGGMSVFYWFMSRLFNRGRAALGMSALLNGTGVVLDADLIREMGWNTRTLTEDLELTAQCGLRGEKIAYLEKAVTYDEQPVTFGVSFEQRRRWFRGSMQTTLRYGPKLVWRAIRHHSLQALDLAIFFLGNIMQFVCLVPGAVAAVQTVRFVAGLGGVEVVAALAVAVASVYIAAISLGAAPASTRTTPATISATRTSPTSAETSTARRYTWAFTPTTARNTAGVGRRAPLPIPSRRKPKPLPPSSARKWRQGKRRNAPPTRNACVPARRLWACTSATSTIRRSGREESPTLSGATWTAS